MLEIPLQLKETKKEKKGNPLEKKPKVKRDPKMKKVIYN